MELAYFTLEGDRLVPASFARSHWSGGQMHGVAIAGALGRAVELRLAALGRDDLQPARLTVDLFRPAAMAPCSFETTVVREAPRIAVIDVVMVQDDGPVARASCLFLKPSQTAPGEVWEPSERPSVPPTDVVPPSTEPRVPFLFSGGEWSQDFGAHQNAERKQSWNSAPGVVAGEQVTPFQAAAMFADGVSLVTNWGSAGVQYINTDITLTLARRPTSTEIGLSALDRVEVSGIAVNTAAMHDRDGQFGNVVMTAISNAKRGIDFETISYDDDGTRRGNV